eukprot:TRINITY_DN24073_c0_g1_i1.p1 TRINITY_DN24073_c0_g1~~TRINITY_DN24073_c0_g1_i1.p1  ORF type:complete len:390 (-),score=77.25 TRINITY_DN24073_c0_g1_i1:324-1493(-)
MSILKAILFFVVALSALAVEPKDTTTTAIASASASASSKETVPEPPKKKARKGKAKADTKPAPKKTAPKKTAPKKKTPKPSAKLTLKPASVPAPAPKPKQRKPQPAPVELTVVPKEVVSPTVEESEVIPTPTPTPTPTPDPTPTPVATPDPTPAPRRVPQPSSRLPTLTILRFEDEDEESGEIVPPCTCSQTGVSGGIATNRQGCAEHIPGWAPFCYVVDPTACTLSQPSSRFIGARWRNCTISESVDNFARSSAIFETASTQEEQQAEQELKQYVAEPDPVVEVQAESVESGACACTETGVSGSIQTERIGCKAHIPGRDKFCYVVDPPNCQVAKDSQRFPGAGLRTCMLSTDSVVIQEDNALTATIIPFTNEGGELSFGLFVETGSS